MTIAMQAPNPNPKPKVRLRLKVTKFDLLKLVLLYVALAPIFAMGLYNHLVFFPFKVSDQDLTPYFEKIQKITNSKVTDLTIPSGTQKLDAWYFKKAGAKKVIIVSHGNGGEIAHRLILSMPLLSSNSSVLLYDYEGYGKSTGEPTIPAVRQDGLAVYDYVHDVLHYAPQDIILYGESLGSGVATYIARNRTVGGIIIQSGFASLSMAAKDRLFWLNLYPAAAFNGIEMDNAAYLRGKHPPVLLMHGDVDIVLPIKHAYKSFEEASQPKTFVKFEGCGHNDMCTYKLFTPTIIEFMKSLPAA